MSQFWINICIEILAGAIGGFGGHLYYNKKSLHFPKRYKDEWYLGFLADITIGAIAALIATNSVALIVSNGLFETESLGKIISISLITGVGGESFLRSRLQKFEHNKGGNVENISEQLKKLSTISEELEKQAKNKKGNK